MEIRVYEALKRFVKERNYELIIFHNGRLALYRPFLGLARNLHINFIATEHFDAKNITYKNDFINNVPHSVEANMEKARKLWNDKNPVREKNVVEIFMNVGRDLLAKEMFIQLSGKKVNFLISGMTRSSILLFLTAVKMNNVLSTKKSIAGICSRISMSH